MTIKRQRVNNSSLVEVEADNTDEVDTNGFSDSINTVAAKTAKFSGGSTMQPNAGLRIGLTQVKVNSGAVTIPLGTTIPTTNVTNPGNVVDGSAVSFSGPDVIAAGVTAVTVDYGTLITAHTRIRFNTTTVNNALTLVEYSTDNVIWIFATSTATNTTTIQDVTSIPEFTYRYLRIRVTSNPSSIASQYYLLIPVVGATSNVNINIRSSTSLDTANGTILDNVILSPSSSATFDTELLFIPSPEFFTVEIVSFGGIPIPVTMSQITSIKEV